MAETVRPVITSAAERPREGWDDPVRGRVSWHTLFSSDITPTDSMCAGIAEVAAGGALRPHRHAEAEIYHILEGTGVLTLGETEGPVTAGQSVFIPGDMPHGLRNEGTAPLRLFYVFPTGRFADVAYRWPD